MKKNNKNLILMSNLIINRAVYIIALFIFLIDPIYSQINQLENKCLWISRESMVDEESIESALLFAHESEFNKVFLQIRGRGDAFYNSDIVKKNANITNSFDPLKYAIKLGHALNLEIHVWINCYILWSDTSYPLD